MRLFGNVVFQDEETGAWYQHKGRDFKVPLLDDVPGNGNLIGAKKVFGKRAGVFFLFLSVWTTLYARYLHLTTDLSL